MARWSKSLGAPSRKSDFGNRKRKGSSFAPEAAKYKTDNGKWYLYGFCLRNISVLRRSSRGGSYFAPEAAKYAKPLFGGNRPNTITESGFSFLLYINLSMPFIKKQPFCSTVIYSSMFCLTDSRERRLCFFSHLYRKIAAVVPSTHRYFVYPKVTTVTSRFGSSATVSPTVASRSACFSEEFYG